jgi:hypothetical protein
VTRGRTQEYTTDIVIAFVISEKREVVIPVMYVTLGIVAEVRRHQDQIQQAVSLTATGELRSGAELDEGDGFASRLYTHLPRGIIS